MLLEQQIFEEFAECVQMDHRLHLTHKLAFAQEILFSNLLQTIFHAVLVLQDQAQEITSVTATQDCPGIMIELLVYKIINVFQIQSVLLMENATV